VLQDRQGRRFIGSQFERTHERHLRPILPGDFRNFRVIGADNNPIKPVTDCQRRLYRIGDKRLAAYRADILARHAF